MDPSQTDFAAARDIMVDGQLRPNKVTDTRILGAMRRIPREAFLPPALAARAYADEDVPLPGGRALTEPMVVARLIQAAAVTQGETALVVAAGAGYAAAVLAACGATVTAVENDPALLALARKALAVTTPGVALVEGDPTAGWPAGAPYDVILIDGAVPAIPAALVRQVRPHAGRIVCVLRPDPAPAPARAVIAEATAAGVHPVPLFDCSVPLIPAFAPAPRFVFS
ncbi:MAG: protein-L-isoaspartate O-methyltransferase [Proteobacteria bacterium]|nr:protein-L-isoaspartate O-methyltransferase [Pseudomonadota bacterium]